MVSVGFRNPKPPLDRHPLGFEVGDPPPTAGCFEQAGLSLSGVGLDVNSKRLSVQLDNPKSIIIIVFVNNDQAKIFFFTKIAI